MLDSRLRQIATPWLDFAGRMSLRLPITANQLSLLGFLVGMAGCAAIAFEHYLLGLGLIVANRVLDAIDGAVARQKGVTDFGGYLDIVLDFFFYAAVPCAFAHAAPENALAAAVLILTFVGTGSSFLAYAIICAKKGITTVSRGRKSFYYMGGLTESTETTLFFVAFCLFPQSFSSIAYILAVLCLFTFMTRIYAAYENF